MPNTLPNDISQRMANSVYAPSHDQNDRQFGGRKRTTKAQYHLYANRGLELRRKGK